MPSPDDLVLQTISILRDAASTSQSGIVCSSDQVTYPSGLERVSDDVFTRTCIAARVTKLGSLFRSDDIIFEMHGEFRAFDQVIENDPNSRIMPVLANVSFDLIASEKAGDTELEVRFTALLTPFGPPEDPRLRFLCEGHYDPAGSGDCRFRALLEVNQNAEVNVIEGPQVIGGSGNVTDDSPSGFSVSIEAGGVIP